MLDANKQFSICIGYQPYSLISKAVLIHLVILFPVNVISTSTACSRIVSPELSELNQWQWTVSEMERVDRANEDDSLAVAQCRIEPGTGNALSRRNLARRLP